MADTFVVDRQQIDNFVASSGYNVITDTIQELAGIGAVLPAMIPYTEPMDAEEAQKLRWRKEGYFPWTVTVNGALGTSDTSLVLDESGIVQIGQILQTPNGEDIRVTANDTGSNIATITRGVNGTTAAAIADNAVLNVSAPIYGTTEQAGYSPAKYGEFVENYYSHLGWRLAETEWSTATPSYLQGDDVTRMARAKRKLMAEQIPRQFEFMTMYGNSAQMTGSTPGSFKGISNFLTTNVTASTGDLSMIAIMDALDTISDNEGNAEGQTVRTLVGNTNMRRIFTALGRGYSQYFYQGNTRISPTISVSQFETDVGRVDFLTVKQIKDGELYALKMDDFKYVPLNIKKGLGAGWVEFMQEPQHLGIRACEWHYWFAGTLFVGHEERHHKWTGVTTSLAAYPGAV